MAISWPASLKKLATPTLATPRVSQRERGGVSGADASAALVASVGELRSRCCSLLEESPCRAYRPTTFLG